MSRVAKATLLGSLVFTVGIVYTVHSMQRQESEVRRSILLHVDHGADSEDVLEYVQGRFA